MAELLASPAKNGAAAQIDVEKYVKEATDGVDLDKTIEIVDSTVEAEPSKPADGEKSDPPAEEEQQEPDSATKEPAQVA